MNNPSLSTPTMGMQCDGSKVGHGLLEPSLQRVLEKGPGILCHLLTSADGSIALPFISPNCWSLFECTAAEIQANVHQWLSGIYPADQASFYASLMHSMSTQQTWRWEGRWILPSGRIQRIQLLAHPEVQSLQTLFWDGILLPQADLPLESGDDLSCPLNIATSELAQSLQTAEQQARLLQTVIDATHDWIFVKDHNFRYILVNQSYAAAIGSTVEAILGKDDIELGFPKELVFGDPSQGIRGFRTDDQTVLAGQRISNPYDPATAADGTLRIFDTQKIPLSADGKIFAVLGFCHDVTERVAAEDKLKQQTTQLEQTLVELQSTQTQLVQSEKMSSLGQLVAGVAHEINNPVNFIYGNLNHANEYTQDLLRLLSLYEKHYPNPVGAIKAEAEAIDLDFLMTDLPKLLGSLKVGADRIQKIVASLRSFSRLDEAEVKDVDIHEGIDSTLMILHNRLKSKSDYPAIQIVKDYSTLPRIECYAGQLNQVFMNILSNAIDALDEQNQSRSPAEVQERPSVITIQTRVVGSDGIAIHIADNGPGIPEAVQKRLFDPFFTTKAVGKGTGMGMSISHQVITERHKGQLTCRSAPGQGATFVIEIPMRQTA